MRRFAILLLCAGFAATIAGAALADPDPNFKGPGWYAISYELDDDGSVESAAIVGGPFADEDSCKATLQEDIPAFHNECAYLDSGE